MLRLIKPKSRIAPIFNAIFILSFLIVNAPTAQGGFFSYLKNISNYGFSFKGDIASERALLFADYNLDASLNGQTINVCSGNFYDSGGPTGNYYWVEDYSVTFCSDNDGPIVIDFTSFSVNGTDPCIYDYFEIFDGPTDADALVGKYCDVSPGTITSTGTCLHFHFNSAGAGGISSGWEASISCIEPIGVGYTTCNNTDELGGLIFHDANLDGSIDAGEPFLEGMTVNIFDENSQVSTTTSNANGEFLFTGLAVGEFYRVEYVLPVDHEEGPMGADSKSSVQFVMTGTCNASLGVIIPEFYCQPTPDFATTCFVDGEPTATGTSGNLDVLVSTSVTSSGTSATVNKLAINEDMGSIWGLAYEQKSKTLFSASFLKRHAGFGPLGIGGIYTTDYTNPTSPVITNWLDINSLAGVSVGTDPRNYALPPNAGVAHMDSLAFREVGKVGIGGIDISADGETLYVMSLAGNGELLAIDIATKTLISQTAIPNPGCGDALDVRPFAVKVFKDEVYVGIVCSGEISGQADLHFNVMKLSGSTFTNVIDASLDFEKGDTHTSYPDDCDGWETWTSTFADIHEIGAIPGVGARWCRNQPMLTDIEFDYKGNMILGFADRGGHQLGFQQYTTATTAVGNGYNGGDILKVYNNNGTYEVENNGTTTNGEGCGSNGEGIGGGEFYCGEVYDTIHQETSTGGLGVLPYSGEVMLSSMDPLNIWSGGIIWLDNSTGAQTQALQLYLSTSGSGSYGKGAGIGDIELLCNPAPVSIGNLVWWDKDKDGVQDSNEKGLPNITLTITDASDISLGTTTTDANGNYTFDNNNVTGGLAYETLYKVKITVQDFQSVSPSDATNDNIDSDGILDDVTVIAQVTTGAPGELTHSIDFGLTGTAGLGNRVWVDENTDGVQNAGERGIADVVIYLYDENSNLIDSTITDADGGYIFKSLPTDDYTVKIGAGIPTGLNLVFDEDSGMNSPDGEVLATIPNDGEYVTADFGYNWVTKAETDAPTTMTATGALGDRVWNDANSNGIQDAGEAGIANVTINLYNDPEDDGVFDNLVASTTTDANGYYIFDNLVPDAYEFSVEESGVTSQGFNAIPSGDPDDDNNSFAKAVIIAPGDVWLGGDFGYNNPSDPADIGSYVFIDADANGNFVMGVDVGLPGVTVALINDTDEDGVWDANEEVAATTITAPDGSYNFPDLNDDKYVIVITDANNVISDMTNSVDPDGGSDQHSAVDLTGSDQLSENFGYVPVGHTSVKSIVGNLIFLDADGNGFLSAGDSGLEGVEVELLDGNTDAVIERTKTNESGLYLFGSLDAGDYKVKVNTTTIPSGLSNSIDPDGSAPGDNITNTFNLPAGASNMTKDFGYKANTPRTISGTIWEDENAEGTFEPTSEMNRFENVTLFLYNTSGDLMAITTTATDGTYSFVGIPDGTYTIEISDVGEMLHGYWHTEGTDSELSPKVVAVSGGNIMDVDFGYYKEGASLGNFVWSDYNGDGIQDANEPGLEGAIVTLNIDYNNDGTNDISVAQVTDETGSYGFEKLLLDEDYQGDGTGIEPVYTISVVAPNAAFTATANIDSGGNDNLDSDVHTNLPVSPEQGKRNIALTNVTETQASFDFAFVFDCTYPSTEYAMTVDATDAGAAQTTDHFYVPYNGSFKHESMVGQKNGIIRATNYCESDGWRYYYNPLDPEEYLFAIRMNGNTTEIDYVELRIDDNATDRYKETSSDATFVMMRDWYVKTKNGAALTANVDVRFYFPPNEFEQMFDDAVDKAVNDWGVSAPTISDVIWFKKDTFDPDSDIDPTASVLTPNDITNLENASTAVTGDNTPDTNPVGNSKNHIQFNGVSSLGGGTAMLRINQNSLPVELTEFRVIEAGCNLQLLWITESEDNFDYYEIQKSKDGNYFETLEIIEGRGTNTTQYYRYDDTNADGLSYYRLRMVDKDGSAKYSTTVNAKTNCGEGDGLIIYPNPINAGADLLNVKFYSDKKDIQLVISDMLGRKVKVLSLEVEETWNTINIDISNLPAGTYHLLQTGNGNNQKFVVRD